MSRDWRLFWRDIIERCERVRTFTAGMDRVSFFADRLTHDAVLLNLQIIGEAVKRLPPEARGLAPAVDWKAIAGMRDVLVHAYFSLDDEILWDAIANDVPALLQSLRAVQLPP